MLAILNIINHILAIYHSQHFAPPWSRVTETTLQRADLRQVQHQGFHQLWMAHDLHGKDLDKPPNHLGQWVGIEVPTAITSANYWGYLISNRYLVW